MKITVKINTKAFNVVMTCGVFGLVLTACGNFEVSDDIQKSVNITSYSSMKCEPAKRGTSEYGVRRLTKSELVASLNSLFGAQVMSASTVVQSLGAIPEQSAASAAQFDNNILDVEGLESAADTITGLVANDPALLDQVVGGCASSDINRCKDSLVNKFAYKAFRRPLLPDTKVSIQKLVDTVGGVEGIRQGMIRVITSPFFHQLVELGESADCVTNCPASTTPDGRLKLSQYEVASRLAFQLTGAPPDQTLLDLAGSGKLSDIASVRAQAVRLMGLPVARDNWRRITGDWLGIHHTSDPDKSIAADFGIAPAGFGEEAREEMLRFSTYEIFDKRGNFQNFFTDKVAIPYTDRLAKTYGVPMSSQATAVTNGLGGILLRPATLLTANGVTSPILRGVLIQRKVLCNELPEPDPNLVNSRLANTADITHVKYANRDMVETVTSPVTCMGCHSQINPIGFTLEKFGPLGAPRQSESIFDQNGLVASHPINTSVQDLKIDAQRAIASAGADDTVAAIATSDAAKQCFNETLIMNTRYRAVSSSDGCLISELGSAQNDGKSLLEVLINNVANDEIFFKTAAGVQ